MHGGACEGGAYEGGALDAVRRALRALHHQHVGRDFDDAIGQAIGARLYVNITAAQGDG